MDPFFLVVLVILVVVAFLFIKLVKFLFKIVFVGIIIVSLFLVATNFVSGSDIVFDGNVKSGASVVVDEYSFIVTMNSAQDRIFVDGLSIRASVPVTGCSEKEIFTFCFTNVSQDTTEEPYTTYANINISRQVPDLKVTRTFNKSVLITGELAKVSLNITSEGDTAFDINYVDDFPAEFEIVDVDGYCKQVGNSIIFTRGYMNTDVSFDCEYTIRGLSQFEGALSAEYSFGDGFKKIHEEKTTSKKLTVSPLFFVEGIMLSKDEEISEYPLENSKSELDFSDDNEDYHLNEEVRLVLNVSNLFDEKISINSFKIEFPDSLKYLGTGQIRYRWANESNASNSLVDVESSGKIDEIKSNYVEYSNHDWSANYSKMFVLRFKTSQSGRINFKITADYTTEEDDLNFVSTYWERFTVKDAGIKLRVYLQDKDAMHQPRREIEDGEIGQLESLNVELLRIFVENLNPYVFIEDIVVTPVTSMIDLESLDIEKISKGGSEYTHQVDMIVPKVLADKTYAFNVTVDYKNEYGESYSNSTEVDFKVNKFEDLKITHESSEGLTVDEGQEIIWSTTVENPRLVKIPKLEVNDLIPPEFTVEGVHGRTLVLKQEAEAVVYTYTLTAPKVSNETTFKIITNTHYFDWDAFFDYNFSEFEEIIVQPKSPDVTIFQELSESTLTVGDIIPLSYTITNADEEETAYNLIIRPPKQSEIDIVGPKVHKLDRLGPKESVKIEDIFNVFVKVNGSHKINKSVLEFYDADKNQFFDNSTIISINPSYAKSAGPIIFVEVLGDVNITESEEVSFPIKIRNAGQTTTEVSLVSDGLDKFEWEGVVPASSFRVYYYKTVFDDEGVFNISNISAEYEYQSMTFNSHADIKTVNVANYVPKFTKLDSSTKLSETASITNLSDEDIIGVDEITNFEPVNGETLSDEGSSSFSNKTITLLKIVSGLVLLIIVLFYFFHKKGNQPDKLPFLK
ncbi:hypothetical protein HN587_04690 [Candidatus Woesearchaeota archaeon]|jgi:hypothetical protein|nr:hypothetical protein [Candidatus Woesearchaeota archaeon]